MYKTLSFDHEPSYAELWGATTRILYNEHLFSEELISFLKKYCIDENSRLADVAAGEGFPSLYLRKRGFDVDCFDLSSDQVSAFRTNALKYAVNPSITQTSWLDIPRAIGNKQYSFVMCRGNSFIYSPGGWNSNAYDDKSPLDSYKITLKIFYDMLSPGGILYLDKFKDSEQDHHKKVCNVLIGNRSYDMIFHTHIDWGKKERYASMLLFDGYDGEKGLPNTTYALLEQELRELSNEVGFSKFERLCLKNDRLFDIYLMYK